MKLKPNYGYWKLSTGYPIGGDFGRAGNEGKEILRIVRTFSPVKGCDTEVEFSDLSRGAISSAHIDKQ